MTTLAGDHYIVISSDGHAGAQVHEYRDYLESKYHDEFDAWEATFVNPFEDLRADFAYRNWDSAARLRELEDDGVVAEVLFPNTIPPFFPSGNLLARPPADDEYELRWAGLKAHNRWLVDFCADTPGRRAGMAQVFLNDVDAAVAEVEWAAEQGLRAGILLPGVPPDSGLPPLYTARVRPPLGGVPGPRHADQQPQRRRRSRAGARRHRHGRVHGRAGVVLAPGVLAHGHRRGVRPLPRHQADPHRAVERLGTRHPRDARPPVPALPRPEHRGVALRRRGRQGGDRAAEPLLAHQLLRGRELLPAVRDAAAPRDRRRPHHVGPGLSRTSRRPTRTPPRPCATASPASTPTRWRAWSGSMPPRSTASISMRWHRWRSASGPTVAEVAVPLDEIPADSRSIAFAGEGVKPW